MNEISLPVATFITLPSFHKKSYCESGRSSLINSGQWHSLAIIQHRFFPSYTGSVFPHPSWVTCLHSSDISLLFISINTHHLLGYCPPPSSIHPHLQYDRCRNNPFLSEIRTSLGRFSSSISFQKVLIITILFSLSPHYLKSIIIASVVCGILKWDWNLHFRKSFSKVLTWMT